MEYTKEILENLHRIQLDILQVVIKLCDEHKIVYFSMGGTTLGAIRHSGIIPWDDDIDIGMLREDYEKFLMLARTNLPEGYVLQHFSTEKNCPTYFAKVRKKNTLFVEEYMDDLDIEKGIYIDIKPLDYVPNNKMKFKLYRAKVRIAEQFFLAKILNKTGRYHSTWCKYLLRMLCRKILYLGMKPFNREKLFLFLENNLIQNKYEKSNMVSFRGEWKTLAEKNDYLPVKSHAFNGIQICIPGNAEKILIKQFGKNYLEPKELVKNGHRPIRIKY